MILIPLNFLPHCIQSTSKRTFSSQRGFALVTTLILMAFVLILLLLITSWVKTEKQSLVAGAHQRKARSYASLGIKKALGELQKATGKDQVTTATADIFVNSENSLSIVSPFWVGVWDTKKAWESDPDKPFYVNQSAWDQLTQKDKLTLASRWLISGEDYKPNDQIDPTLLIDGIPAYAKMATIPKVRGLPNATLSKAVYAPKEFIRIEIDKPVEGNYAWWISDEGVKAKINVSDNYLDLQEEDSIPARYRASLSQRPAPDRLISEDAYDPSVYQKLLDLDMFSYFDNLSTPPPEGQTIRQDYFFDFTPSSFGVLSNPRQGGLKKDLSIAFDIPEAFTKDVNGILTFDPEKLDPFFHRPIIDESLSRDHPDYRDNYLFLLEDVVFESSHDLYEGTGGEDPIAGPPWNLLAYHHNLYQKTNEDIINLIPLFNEDTPNISWINHGVMAAASTNTFNTLYKGQSKHSYLYDKRGNHTVHVLNQKEESVTYPVAPILTEFQLSIEIEYSNNGEIYVHYKPILELTNPYDIEISTEDLEFYQILMFGLHTLIDFKLSPNSTGDAIGLGDNIWSNDLMVIDNNDPNNGLPEKIFVGGHHRDKGYKRGNNYYSAKNYSGVHYGDLMKARFLNNILRTQVNFRNYPRTCSEDLSRLSFRIQKNYLKNFKPGEVKKYFYTTNEKQNSSNLFFMIPGSRPESRKRDIRSYTLRQHGNKLLPQYLENDTDRGYEDGEVPDTTYKAPEKNGRWPSHPSCYDQLQVEVLSAPAFAKDNRKYAHNVEMRQFFKYNGKSYQTGTVDLRPHQLMQPDGSNISSDPKVFTLNKGDDPVPVLNLRMYLVSENEMGEVVDKDHFLGGSNPRAVYQTIDSGLEVESNDLSLVYVPNLRLEVDEDPSSENIATFGSWGNLNQDHTNAPLFHMPRNRPLSLGDYRHANLSMVSHEPAMPIGNSLIPPFGWESDESDTWKSWLSSKSTVGDSSISVSFGNNNISTENEVQYSNVLIDTSYHINSALWDSYFLSTLTLDTIGSFVSSDASDPLSILPNSRIVTKSSNKNADKDILSDFERSAGELIIDGAFNVNSTSVKAWGALLRSMQEIRSASSENQINDVFLRSPLLPTDTEDEWAGANSLDTELLYNPEDTAYTRTPESLAGQIVQQVKSRGPFLSLAHFVNRNLINGDDRSKAGALHQAILESEINGSQNAFAPGSLSQADLMGALGATLASRSDTFVIRAKGESIESLTGEVKAEAWCEAVVQRLPNYMDESQNPDEKGEELNSDNLTYGRRYHITSIRWLSENEI